VHRRLARHGAALTPLPRCRAASPPLSQIVGTVYRSRYYFAWSNGWASLAFAGFDFLKWDEKTGKAVWGRGCNSRPLKVRATQAGATRGAPRRGRRDAGKGPAARWLGGAGGWGPGGRPGAALERAGCG
jgi:hypothetical protein